MRTRLRVREHRLTRQLWYGVTARFWVESDPEHGGVGEVEAAASVERAVSSLSRQVDHMEAAGALLEMVPAANSVEVCDASGNGTAVHRDWP